MVRVVHLYLYAWKKTEWYNDEDKKKKKKSKPQCTIWKLSS